MRAVFLQILNMSVKASWLILAVLAVRVLLRRAPKWAVCLLWGLVFVRLLCPLSVESTLSWLPSQAAVGEIPVQEAVPDSNNGKAYQPPSGREGAGYNEAAFARIEANAASKEENADSKEANAASKEALDTRVTVELPHEVLSVLACLWLAGFVGMAAYAFGRYVKLKRTVAASVVLFENVRACDEISSPFVLGIFRPVIYVPSSMGGQTLSLCLRHERAHICRRDHWWKPLGFLALSLHWFNPLCWLSYILFSRDIEGACDERVIRDMDREGRAAYSEVLLKLGFQGKPGVTFPLAFGGNGVKGRVKAVLQYKRPKFWIIMAAGILVVILAICFLTDSPNKASTVPASGDSGLPERTEDLHQQDDGTEAAAVQELLRSGLRDDLDIPYFQNLSVQDISAIWKYSEYPPFSVRRLEGEALENVILALHELPDDLQQVTSSEEIGDGDPDYLIIEQKNGEVATIALLRPFIGFGKKMYRAPELLLWDVEGRTSPITEKAVSAVAETPSGTEKAGDSSEKSMITLCDYSFDGELYHLNGKMYRNKLSVQGRSPNAKRDSCYVVLTNRASIAFDVVDKAFWSSNKPETWQDFAFAQQDFVIVEYGTVV